MSLDWPGVTCGLVDSLDRNQVFNRLLQAQVELVTETDTVREMLYFKAILVYWSKALLDRLAFQSQDDHGLDMSWRKRERDGNRSIFPDNLSNLARRQFKT